MCPAQHWANLITGTHLNHVDSGGGGGGLNIMQRPLHFRNNSTGHSHERQKLNEFFQRVIRTAYVFYHKVNFYSGPETSSFPKMMGEKRCMSSFAVIAAYVRIINGHG